VNTPSDVLNWLGAALPAMPLLWLAAALAAHGRAEGDAVRPSLLAVALGLGTAGLWWPLHGGWAAEGALGLVLPLATAASLAAVLALTNAAGTGRDAWHAPRRAAVLLGAWIIAVACLSTASTASAHSGWTWALRCLAGALCLVGGLLTLVWPAASAVASRRLRLGASIGTPLCLALVAGPAAYPAWPSVALPPMVLLVFIGAMTLLALSRMPATRPRNATKATAPEREPSEDPLTGLATRTSFEAHLEGAVRACDATQQRLALLFIDLDGFKPVNDTFGHASGDRVLRSVGERLRALHKEGGERVARVGGDEFLVLLATDASQDGAAARARQIVQTLSRPYEVDGRQVAISCSIGIAFYPDGGSPAKLIARADAAMYAAKRAGGAGFTFFTPAMEDDARDRFDLLRDLRSALERKELELFYQPKIDAATGKVTAAEALLRWQHPARGMVPPAVFIPIAERFGLIRDIGQWVIEDACRQARVWQEHGLRMRVAINLSAVQMRQEDIVARIEGALARHRVDPSRLTCEITESVAMEDTRATQATFHELGAAGIHLSIDDFGTGYSSLAYLRKLPAEELKIDRSFITDLEHSPDARSIVDAVLKLAHALGLKVVAEGVENERQRDILTEMGCDELQGFLFAKPMTARALLLWAMDDRQEHADAFATSLFVSTQRAGLAEQPAQVMH
jgi:diguanylate cyclase